MLEVSSSCELFWYTAPLSVSLARLGLGDVVVLLGLVKVVVLVTASESLDFAHPWVKYRVFMLCAYDTAHMCSRVLMAGIHAAPLCEFRAWNLLHIDHIGLIKRNP